MDKNLLQAKDSLVVINIDDKDYTIGKNALTGSELRQLANVSISAGIWAAVTGTNNDRYIKPEETIELQTGLKFYTAKMTISPNK